MIRSPAWLSACALLLFAAGCRGPAREAEVVRLLELATSARTESTWPGGRPRAVPESIEDLRNWRQVRKRKIGRVSMFPPGGGDNRRSLVAPTGTVHRFAVQLPENAVLRAGLGYVSRPELPGVRRSAAARGRAPAREPSASQAVAGGDEGDEGDEGEGAEVRFMVRLSGGDGEVEVTVLDETVTVRDDGGWLDVEVDLGRWSGRAVGLSLSVTGSASEPTVWAAWSAPEIVRRDAVEAGPDVVLIVLDTLRADGLGCYGQSLETSPNLDRFAASGVRFERAVSQAPWTYPSHRSLFSGLFPTARDLEDARKLAEVLRDAGFRTEAVTGGGQMDFRMGFAKGFDTYRVYDWIRDPDWLADWLARSARRRRFLFLHTYEIHDPYIHSELVEEKQAGRIRAGFGRNKFWGLRKPVTGEEREFVRGLYDSGIAYTDRQLEHLLAGLEQSGALERSIVIVTSDHGEQFWEHGSWRHGMNLYDEQLLVPLIVRLPRELRASLGAGAEAGSVIQEQVRLVDLYPTLLDLLEIQLPHRPHGRSLRPLLEGGTLAPVDAFAERLNLENRDSKALRTERYKFIYSFPKARGQELGVPEHWELYDLTADPGEQVNLADRYPEEVAELDARLRSLMRLLNDPLLLDQGVEELDPDLEERLRALGYLGQ